MGGGQSPVFFNKTRDMLSSDIQEKILPAVRERGCFLVDVAVSADNDVTLTIESEEGTVRMDDCVAIDKAFHEIWDQDAEDYALTVTSAGLDQPFRVARQFEKALGSEVEVLLRGGRKLTGTLLAYADGTLTLRYSAREAVPGSKKKQTVVREDAFPAEEVNAVRPHLTFE